MRFFSFSLRRAALPSTQEREGHMPYCRPRGHGKGHTPHCRQGRAHTALPSAQTGKACAAMPSTQARRTYAAMSVRFPCIDVHRWRQSICPLGQRFPRGMPARTGARPSRPASAPQSHADRSRRTPSQVSIPSPSRRRTQSFHHATVKVRRGLERRSPLQIRFSVSAVLFHAAYRAPRSRSARSMARTFSSGVAVGSSHPGMNRAR